MITLIVCSPSVEFYLKQVEKEIIIIVVNK